MEMVGTVAERQYENRIEALRKKGMCTQSIENTVEKTIENIKRSGGRSFVIFGEPQCGKTEMMIALNARILDEQPSCVIINLLTDSIDLLEQNLSRFRDSGLCPSPKQLSELTDPPTSLGNKKWILFSKKNAKDLEKLISLLDGRDDVIIIDDEADFASPNAKVNTQQKTKIHQLIRTLLGKHGQYIGVTATPARLNLNNTFDNDSQLWVEFCPHPHYVGQNFFFPRDGNIRYQLHTFAGSDRSMLEEAILHFLCGVAKWNLSEKPQNFSMLVHTSGKKQEHTNDIEIIKNTLNKLSDRDHPEIQAILSRVATIAEGYSPDDPYALVEFIIRHIDRHTVVEINSKTQHRLIQNVAKPASLFTFGAGGNIISRGVTFDNLLSMYFTRTVKGKFAQDTYIQRARMFGSRDTYKEYFQLWIPEDLMKNWSSCFTLHRLAIEALRSNPKEPVWLSGHNTTPTAYNSIDRSTVDFLAGEMSFALFRYTDEHEVLMNREGQTDVQMLESLRNKFSPAEFPQYLYEYLKEDIAQNHAVISFHNPGQFGTSRSHYTDEEISSIRRKKGIFSQHDLARDGNPKARRHLKIYYNKEGYARLVYKINGETIKFITKK